MTIPPWPQAGEEEVALLREVLASDRWGGFHEVVGRFESEFAAFAQCEFGVSAFNGTVTLEMILEGLGIGAGDEVIVPASSFISTATAVSRVGALPVFVDIDEATFNIDPRCVAAAITPATRAIMAVHFGGPMADMDGLRELGVPLIEDAAHAHGSEWSGQRAGSIGVAGSFSFQNSKVMTCGEGGLITTNESTVNERVRAIGNQGRRADRGWFEHYTLGTNYRMTALQAAVLLPQLARLPEQNRRRARNAAIVKEELASCDRIEWQSVPEQASVHTNYLLLGRIADRARFHRAVTQAGVPCTPFYPHTLYNNPLYHAGGCRVMPCPVSESAIGDAFWFPHRVLLGSVEDTREIARAIRLATEA
jgi:dTDP-4-amino-4,6-dideoxygalactose transaminase